MKDVASRMQTLTVIHGLFQHSTADFFKKPIHFAFSNNVALLVVNQAQSKGPDSKVYDMDLTSGWRVDPPTVVECPLVRL